MLRGIVILAALNEETINTCLYVASEIVVILKMVRFLQQKKIPKTNKQKKQTKKEVVEVLTCRLPWPNKLEKRGQLISNKNLLVLHLVWFFLKTLYIGQEEEKWVLVSAFENTRPTLTQFSGQKSGAHQPLSWGKILLQMCFPAGLSAEVSVGVKHRALGSDG